MVSNPSFYSYRYYQYRYLANRLHYFSRIKLFFLVSDIALARRTFASISTSLNEMVSRLASTSCPTPPCPAPAVPLPRWHASAVVPLHRRALICGGGDCSAVSPLTQRCHQLTAVLPEPWATSFAFAHRAFKLCFTDGNEVSAQEAEEEEGLEDYEQTISK